MDALIESVLFFRFWESLISPSNNKAKTVSISSFLPNFDAKRISRIFNPFKNDSSSKRTTTQISLPSSIDFFPFEELEPLSPTFPLRWKSLFTCYKVFSRSLVKYFGSLPVTFVNSSFSNLVLSQTKLSKQRSSIRSKTKIRRFLGDLDCWTDSSPRLCGFER